MSTKNKDQKPGKEAVKATAAPKPMPNQPRWSGLGGGNTGVKKPSAVHGRMPTGRGSARGR
ncbi:hypothetical protein [Kerstersia sp.]|uniref:hypothetical protein n=1 Tax=Kerstersia sp. TaxID=1930783 RepID=UPI003F8DC1F7